jgi:phosphatidylserine/phosphatidylglycerophosphate/cardiolipin synthase-like enzyme/uncharacterized membrane protein YdjX (TVP38/TMEM64 family)
MGTMGSTLLQPGRNVWRIGRASRAAVLVDGAAFFAAVRRACLKAERSIFIVGWDIDSRTRLIGNSPPDDGYPVLLSDFLSALVERKPTLNIYILLWDFSVVYTVQRELFPSLSLQWQTPARVTLCMDDAVPFGASQHQKLVVVDDALAFSGGLDLTTRRWDTDAHDPHEPRRVDASDETYPPFHDVQMMVDGPAAHALARLARRRWCRADEKEPPFAPTGDPWPDDLSPDFADVDVGIARTEPAFNGQEKVEEVERLFHDSIERAHRSIYIENQFMSSIDIARHLAQRLRERPQLEVVTVSPRRYSSWVVASTLGSRRADFVRLLMEAGGDRVRLTYPCVEDAGTTIDTMVHSKVMIVDDDVLRIGSANLNNRSMGVDTECDLVIAARNEIDRAGIRRVRSRLLGDHLGVAAEAVDAMVVGRGSLLAAVDGLSSNGHRLCPLESMEEGGGEISAVLESMVDPRRPLGLWRLCRHLREKAPMISGAAAALLAVLLLIVALTLVWRFTPLSEMITLDRVKALLTWADESGWAPVLILTLYLIGGLIAFPVTILIVATAATFGPWLGFLYATMGVLASALATYGIGAWLGRDMMRAMLGKRWDKLRCEIDNRGVFAVAAIRLLPVAPFTLVNLMAGACSIAIVDYLAGTLIGMLPGLIVVSLMGQGITAVLTDMSLRNVIQLLVVVLAWIAIAWTAQKLIGRLRRWSS